MHIKPSRTHLRGCLDGFIIIYYLVPGTELGTELPIEKFVILRANSAC